MKSSVALGSAAHWRIATFLGGLSFTGFYFLPPWLILPLFFLTPVVGPFLLLAEGALALRHARSQPGGAALRPGRLAALVAAIALVPVAVLDLLLAIVVPYIGLLLALVAFPLHYACVVAYGTGVAAEWQAAGESRRATRLVLPVVAGLLAGFLLVFLRFAIVPRSTGVFLKVFSSSGAELRPGNAPLDPHGQRDLAETLGVHPRSLHEPIAALGVDSLWTASRGGGDCHGHWIQRRAVRAGAAEWRRCIASEPDVVRNPTGMAVDPSEGVFVVGFDVAGGLESWWMKYFDAQGRQDERRDKAFPAQAKIDRSYSAVVGRDGSVYVLGESGDIDRRGTYGWVRKFDSNGRETLDGWAKRFPNAGERRPTMAAIAGAVDGEGHLYVLLDLFDSLSLRKFDRDGRELPGWGKELSGAKDLTLAVDQAGNVMVAGITGYPDQGWLAKFEPDGTPAWEKNLALGHLTAAYAVGFDPTGAVFAAGATTGAEGKSSNWWIKKFAPDGRELAEWDKAVVGQSLGAPFALRLGARGEIYILGSGSGWRFSGSWLERWWGWE